MKGWFDGHMKKIQIGENTPTTMKKLAHPMKFVFILLFILIHYFIFRNMLLLSNDVVAGDFSGEKIKPAPQYGFLRIPGNRLMKKSNAQNRLAADFAQIYFPLKHANGLRKNYISGEFDPWRRSSRIAPLIHYLCAKSYCRLEYGPASLVHLYLQLGLFYISFAGVFVSLKIVRHLPLAILLVNIGLFLTPAGLAWFERGQFSLYVAMAYLFIMLGILKNKPFYFLLGGLFAFIKWTSFPAIFVMIAVYIFASKNIKSLKSSILVVSPFFVVILLLLLLFPKEGYYFMQGLYLQEAFVHPDGVSLVRLLPVVYVKLMPLALILLGISHTRKYGENWLEHIAFFTGACILMLTYPSLAYEYSVSTLFCFIPLIVYWCEYPGDPGWTTAKTIMKYTFFLFLLVASNSEIVARVFNTEYAIFGVYAFVSAIFLFVPLLSFNYKVKSLSAEV